MAIKGFEKLNFLIVSNTSTSFQFIISKLVDAFDTFLLFRYFEFKQMLNHETRASSMFAFFKIAPSPTYLCRLASVLGAPATTATYLDLPMSSSLIAEYEWHKTSSSSLVIPSNISISSFLLCWRFYFWNHYHLYLIFVCFLCELYSLSQFS